MTRIRVREGKAWIYLENSACSVSNDPKISYQR